MLLLLRPASAAAGAGNEAHPAADRVTFSDGATIELVGVSEFPTRPDSWWRADGTPLPKPPVDKLLGFQQAVDTRLMRVFVVDVVTNGQADLVGPTGPKDQYDGQTLVTADTATRRGLLSHRYLIATIRPAARIDLAVEYSAGPWRTLSTTGKQLSTFADRPANPQLIWENTETGKAVPEIWVAHNLGLDATRLWLVAVDSDNVLHQPRSHFESSQGQVEIRRAHFPDVPIDRIKEYRLVTHLGDRRHRFKPLADSAKAPPSDDIVWGEASEEAHATQISCACRIHLKSGRIVAIDVRDREYVSKFGGSESVGNFTLRTAAFPDLPLASVKEFRFQIRPSHHHIEFRDVSLHAGQKNPAHIWLDGRRYDAKAEAERSSK